MFQFFVDDTAFDNTFRIMGDDAHHISRVLRLKPHEKIRVSTNSGESFICDITDVTDDVVLAEIETAAQDTELKSNIRLFQAIPKGDRFDTVVEKSVELGVHEIIPVSMKYCVARWDSKKAASKVKRYTAVAHAAAKQSKRSILPGVHAPMSLKEAIEYAGSLDSLIIVPYENERGMEGNKEAFSSMDKYSQISIFIGPEGGFDEEEIKLLKEAGAHIITLGRRILRTDTAAIAAMTLVMMELEKD